MKRFLLCLLAAVPLTAPCAEHKWYTHVALSDAGPNVATGFHLTEAFSLEVGYRDLHGEGWEVAARAEKHVSPRLSVTGRLGAYDSKEMTISVVPYVPNGQVSVEVDSHGGTHPIVGLGLKLDVSPRWAAFTEFVSVPGLDLGRDSNSTLLVGMSVAY